MKSYQEYNIFIKKLPVSFVCKVVLDEDNCPVDFIDLTVNDTCERTFDVGKNRIVGEMFSETFPRVFEDSINWLGIFGHVAQTGGNETIIDYSDGLDRWFEVIVSCLNADEFILLFKDITKTFKIDNKSAIFEKKFQRIKQCKKALKKSNEESEQFVYVASHNLYEPLRIVASFAKLLEKKHGDQLDKIGKNYIKYAIDGFVRLQKVIYDLLEYSRVNASNVRLSKISAKQAVQRACKYIREIKSVVNFWIKTAVLPR